jgi:predicted dehydrogenase
MSPLRVAVVGIGNIALNYHLPVMLAQPDLFTVSGWPTPSPLRTGSEPTSPRTRRP